MRSRAQTHDRSVAGSAGAFPCVLRSLVAALSLGASLSVPLVALRELRRAAKRSGAHSQSTAGR